MGGGGSAPPRALTTSTHATGIASRAEEEDKGPHVLLCAQILAANVRSDGNQRIQGGRYFIYRPPRTVSQIPSAPVPARLAPLPTRLTSSAPPRPLPSTSSSPSSRRTFCCHSVRHHARLWASLVTNDHAAPRAHGVRLRPSPLAAAFAGAGAGGPSGVLLLRAS